MKRLTSNGRGRVSLPRYNNLHTRGGGAYIPPLGTWPFISPTIPTGGLLVQEIVGFNPTAVTSVIDPPIAENEAFGIEFDFDMRIYPLLPVGGLYLWGFGIYRAIWDDATGAYTVQTPLTANDAARKLWVDLRHDSFNVNVSGAGTAISEPLPQRIKKVFRLPPIGIGESYWWVLQNYTLSAAALQATLYSRTRLRVD
jgi:hypothetical protein